MVLHPLPSAIVLDRFPDLTEADLNRMRVRYPPIQTVAMNANLRYACQGRYVGQGIRSGMASSAESAALGCPRHRRLSRQMGPSAHHLASIQSAAVLEA